MEKKYQSQPTHVIDYYRARPEGFYVWEVGQWRTVDKVKTLVDETQADDGKTICLFLITPRTKN